MHKFKVKPISENAYEVYVDDKKVRCHSLSLDMSTECVPLVRMDVICQPEIEIEGLLELSDAEILSMVGRRLDDDEFFKSLMWEIADASRI